MHRLVLTTIVAIGAAALLPARAFAGRVRGLTAGNAVTCAVTTGNMVLWCWGRNNAGQLGDGTTTEQVWPQRLKDAVIAAPATRDDTTCVVSFAGRVLCAGANNFGQLGDGTNIERHTFKVVGPRPPLQAGSMFPFTAGNTPCLFESGVSCWGWNQFGAVGDGTTTDQAMPVPVAVDLQGVVALETSGADGHTCATKPSATAPGNELWCWGNNENGALGVGSSVGAFSSTPVQVTAIGNVGSFPAFGTLGVGRDLTCAKATSGGLWCWGRNDHGQLGDGTTTPRDAPVQVTGLNAGFVAVSPSGDFACATVGSSIYCWGRNDRGQLGDGTTTERHLPVPVAGFAGQVEELAVGNNHACALQPYVSPSDPVFCWGANDHGQVGDGTRVDRHAPVRVFLRAPPAPLPVPVLGRRPARQILLALALTFAGLWAISVRAKLRTLGRAGNAR